MPNQVKYGIPEGRTRRSVTFDTDVLKRFFELADRLSMPSTTLSAICNDAVAEINKVLALGLEQGNLTLSDVFRLVGSQIDSLLEEERRGGNAAHEKRLAAARRKGLA